MAHLTASIKQPYSSLKTIYLVLNHNRTISPYHLELPITWVGSLDNKPVRIIQERVSAMRDAYSFEEFPKEWEQTKEDVIEVIDKHLQKWGV